MPDEEPIFSSIQLPDLDGEKKKPKKKIVKKKRVPAKTTAVKTAEKAKDQEINKQLASIYRDDKGRLPDMKEIDMRKSHPFLRAIFIILFIGALLAGAAWVGFFALSGGKKYADEHVSLVVSGPAGVTAGATTTYVIKYKNDQTTALQNAVLNIQYPEGFVYISSEPAANNAGHTEWTIGNIAPYKQGEISVTGIMSGSINQKQSWRVLLGYQPENMNSKLQKTFIFDVAADSSPFSLAVTGPDKTIIGNEAKYIFIVKKESDTTIKQLQLKPAIPANFYITSSSPALNKDGAWLIDAAKKTSTSTAVANNWIFKLNGKYSSSSEPYITMLADLFSTEKNTKYSLAQSSVTTNLLQNNLDFSLAINGSMGNFNSQPGDTLNITIYLKNLNTADIKNASLKLILDAPSANKQSIVNWAQITDDKDGDIKGTQVDNSLRRGEISWNKAKLPELATMSQNDEASIDIRLPLKDASSFSLSELTSYKINVIAETTFTDGAGVAHTFSSNPIIITLNSDLKFEPRDSVSEDGQTHEITWVLTNNFHPLKNIALSADVYGDVSLQSDTSTPAGQFVYDKNAKKVAWSIPEMPESVDVLAQPFSITLNKINPSQEMLMSKVHITADDATTGEKLDFLGDEIMLSR